MRIIVFALAALSFIGCKDSSKEFEMHETGVEYTFIEKNKDGHKVQIGDVLVLDMRYYTENGDSLLFDSREVSGNFRMRVDKPNYDGGTIDDAYLLLNVGDSVHFKIDANMFYGQTRRMELPNILKVGDKILFKLRLIDIQDLKKVEEERQKLHFSNNQEEMISLERYLNITNIEVEPSEDGLYYIETEKGTGKKAEAGKNVIVHYTGSFIDGRIFDTSLRRNEPFQFKLGVGDVIEGWDKGILNMREGGKAKLIIPSNLAYGKEGSGNVIPPYSTLIFDVELLQVK